MSEVAVIVPAAGRGTRLGGTRKQFRLLDGKPLLIRSLEVFQFHPAVDAIYVAAPAGEEEQVLGALHAAGIDKVRAVVAGGASRQASVWQALRATSKNTDVVLVHDGVRPFVSASAVHAVIAAVRQTGAAALAIPVADTLRAGRDGMFGETRSREGLYRMQTPQGCRRDWLLEAHQHALANRVDATDDVDLMQRAGFRVAIVEGSALNIKITTRADWEMAALIWPAWRV